MVPLPPSGGGFELELELEDVDEESEFDGGASTKAEGGSPPMVCASPAFRA